MLVNQQPSALFGYQVERKLQLRSAVAAQAVKHVARQAFRVDAHQRRLVAGGNLAHSQHHAFLNLAAERAFKAVDAEVPESAGKIRFGDFGEHWAATLKARSAAR